MKAFGLLILFFSSLALASTGKSVNSTFVEKTYECAQYTDNKYSKENGFETDNSPIDEITVIHQKAGEFIIDKNKIWKDGATMVNLSGESRMDNGSNHNSLFLKKENFEGTPYFMAFFFDDKTANRAVVLGQCVRK